MLEVLSCVLRYKHRGFIELDDKKGRQRREEGEEGGEKKSEITRKTNEKRDEAK